MDAKALEQPVEVEPGQPSEVPRVYARGDLVAGKYRLERSLGEGGQAEVWEARHLALDVRIALKLVHPGSGEDGQALRLLWEARAVARLQHAAVVRVFDVAQTPDGHWFIVMELLDGESLADRIATSRRISSVEAVRLLLPIADALVAAHAAGIVHRDVKPDNIVVARAGMHVQPKLLDFGIAKLRPGPDWKRTTTKGLLIGTPAYLSPEQLAGASDVDHRSDIWSFAATVYECVTGELPFDGDSEHALFRNIERSEPRSIVALNAGNAELWRILQRGLAKSRDDRWPSMHAFGRELARWLLAQSVTEDASGVSLRAKWLNSDEPLTVPSFTTTARTPAAPTAALPRDQSRPLSLVLAGAAAALVAIVLALLRGRLAPEEQSPTVVRSALIASSAAPSVMAPTPSSTRLPMTRADPSARATSGTPLIRIQPPPAPLGPRSLAKRDTKKLAPSTNPKAHTPETSTPASDLRLVDPYR